MIVTSNFSHADTAVSQSLVLCWSHSQQVLHVPTYRSHFVHLHFLASLQESINQAENIYDVLEKTELHLNLTIMYKMHQNNSRLQNIYKIITLPTHATFCIMYYSTENVVYWDKTFVTHRIHMYQHNRTYREHTNRRNNHGRRPCW